MILGFSTGMTFPLPGRELFTTRIAALMDTDGRYRKSPLTWSGKKLLWVRCLFVFVTMCCSHLALLDAMTVFAYLDMLLSPYSAGHLFVAYFDMLLSPCSTMTDCNCWI